MHAFVPRQSDLDAVRTRRCSWLYLEFGAKDGRFLNSFFEHGNKFLEDYLRGTQSYMRAFCSIAFDPDPSMQPYLTQVRTLRAKKAAHFNIFSSVVPSSHDGSEQVSLLTGPQHVGDAMEVRSISLRQLILNTTFDWEHSGLEISHMSSAQGNHNLGNVIVRFNTADMREAYWYLDMLEAYNGTGVMCKRIDRLILNLNPVKLEKSQMPEGSTNRAVVRDWDKIVTPPSSPDYNPENGVEGLVKIAKDINERIGCRTTIHIIDEAGKMVAPTIVSERAIHYAILAGEPTFDERIGAQTATWMTAIPKDRLTIFTNKPRDDNHLKAARGRETVVVQPHRPELEQQLHMMQSWSHLVRVRESWDRVMKHNPDIKWLGLVDDDTFVFPGGMRQYLSNFDPRLRIWGGSGEQARIDNGDAGVFANWLRDLHKKHGGKHCYLPHEDIPDNMKGEHVEYGISKTLNGREVAKKVSHMCGDTFCKMGCPAVPQGAAIFVSRALVEALRPHIEKCEEDTSHLCKNCGSQRLYMCVNRYAGPARTLLTRGICRSPWKLEHREKFPFALTYHGFQRYKGHFLSTQNLPGDMEELWRLGKTFEEEVKQGLRSEYLVPMQRIADLIGCHGKGRFEAGSCKPIEDTQQDG